MASDGLIDFDALDALDVDPNADGIQQSFTLERVIFHETSHGHFSNEPITNVKWPAIQRTNDFMEKYFGQPRRLNHDGFIYR